MSDNAPSKSQRPPNKTQTPSMKNLPELLVRAPSNSRTLLHFAMALGHLPRWKPSPYCWRHHAHQTQGPEAPSWSWPEWMASPWGLLSWYQKAPGKLPKEGSKQWSYPAVRLKNHTSYQHGTIALRVQQWHTYLDGKQQFSSCTYDTFNKREIMIGTGS